MAFLFRFAFDPILSAAGLMLAGGTISFCEPETDTLATIYLDDAQTIPADNPVTLNSVGQPTQGQIYYGFRDYRIVVRNAAGTIIPNGDIDPVHGGIGSGAVTYTAPLTGAVARTQSDKNAEIVSLLDFGATGDGSTDDYVAIQAWLTAIPSDGAGYIPAAAVYYKSGTALTLSGRKKITGDGLGSRIHYTGSGGTTLTWTDARFSSISDVYLTYTSAATGGLWVKGAQEGFYTLNFNCEFSDSIGTSLFAVRYSSSWTFKMIGGRCRGAIGVWADNTNYSVAGVNNNFTLDGVNSQLCTVSLKVDHGYVVNAVNGCDFEGSTTAVEICCGMTGAETVVTCNIHGNYMEGVTNGVLIGANAAKNGPNLSSLTPSRVNVYDNRIDASGAMMRIFKGDLCVIGENEWGVGTITIDAGVLRTIVETVQAVTDNATAGQTTYIRQSEIAAPVVRAYGDLQSGMNRLYVHRDGTDQSINTATATKVQWTTKDLDSPAAFDSATNYRWTPTKSGRYDINATVQFISMADGNLMQLKLYKNGSLHRQVNQYAAAAGSPSVSLAAMVTANGTTDYFEIFVEHNNGAAKDIEGDAAGSWFEARPAV